MLDSIHFIVKLTQTCSSNHLPDSHSSRSLTWMRYSFTYTSLLTIFLSINLFQPYSYAALPSLLTAHVSPSKSLAASSTSSKQIRQNISHNYSVHDLRRLGNINTGNKDSKFHGIVSFFGRVWQSMQGSVSKVYQQIRNKSINNRLLAEKRVGLAAESIFNVSRLLIHADSSDGERYGNLNEDVALSMAYLSNDDKFWQFVNEEQGIRVWKTRTPLCDDKSDRKWVCVMTKTVINAPAAKLRKLLLDSEKVTSLNKYSCGRSDVEVLNSHCKVVWNRSRIPFTIKPFDFCTLIRDFCDPKTGMILIISKAVEHELVPVTKDYARSHVIFGLNVLIPSPDNAESTQFISINHVKYGGIYPALASSGAYQGTVNYVLQLRKIAPELIKEMD
jgi:hypothetical protein